MEVIINEVVDPNDLKVKYNFKCSNKFVQFRDKETGVVGGGGGGRGGAGAQPSIRAPGTD